MYGVKEISTSDLIASFMNGSDSGIGRYFAGVNAPHPALSAYIEPRSAKQKHLRKGDTLSITGLNKGQTPQIIAFDGNGKSCLNSLGLAENMSLNLSNFDSHMLVGWLESNGGSVLDIPTFEIDTAEPLIVLSVQEECDVWVINPSTPDSLVKGLSNGTFMLHIKPVATNTLLLPEPMGSIKDEFTISRATAKAYQLNKGELVQIIDIEGQQCSDFMAFRTDGLDKGIEQRIDSTVTRSLVGGAYPQPGLFDKFYDSEMRPLINVIQDTVGRHDTFALACTARGYEERGFPGHVNCSDNISAILESYGVERRSAWPAINFFFNSWIDHSDNHLQSEESWSRPGDYVLMRAMDDLTCVSTACPDDIDPINGWNPTDIHVRIYDEDTKAQYAIAHREKEDALVSISENSAFHGRTSQLTQKFQAARDLWVPTAYPSIGTMGEYWACRNAATLQDMSPLRKYDIVGPDAERLLQKAMTRDIAKIAQWRGTYTLLCDEQGVVIDDGTLFRLADHLFRWCCGSEESARQLTSLAEGLDVRIKDMRSSLPNLALQGPRSRDILRKIVHTEAQVPTLDQVKWFGLTVARLNDREGAPFMLSRSGYTGELGYEIFCDKSNAEEIWDAVMIAGEEFGLEPMGARALEIIRIEAGLAASGAEFTADVDAFEAGLGFAVDLRKADFVGKTALERNKDTPRRELKGMLLVGDDVPAHGAHVYAGERPVGVVTSATRSPTLEHAIAIVRLAIEHSEDGTELEIGQMDGRMKRLKGTVTSIPFIDPRRERARA